MGAGWGLHAAVWSLAHHLAESMYHGTKRGKTKHILANSNQFAPVSHTCQTLAAAKLLRRLVHAGTLWKIHAN